MLATVTGTVTDKDGDPVSGVDLTVVNEDGEDVLSQPALAQRDRCVLHGRRRRRRDELPEDR